MMPSKKHRGSGVAHDFIAASKGLLRKTLNLNIYRSKNIDASKDDENYEKYEKRVQVKDLIFYMKRDPELKKSKVLYQTQVKF
jgi:hypothetical protein